jgi:hypothetical protein
MHLGAMIIDGLLPSTKMAATNDAEQTKISDLKLQATSYIAVIGKANAIEERARWTFSTVRISLKHSFFFGERRT